MPRGSPLKGKLLLVLIAEALVCCSRAQTHHSFAATYFVDVTNTIEGTVAEFLFRNPHSFLKVEAPDDKGQMQTWSVEWAGGGQLSQARVTRDFLKPGDHVIITGNTGRDASEHRMRMKSIARPSDGWKWEGIIR
jgi:hypothetical protein